MNDNSSEIAASWIFVRIFESDWRVWDPPSTAISPCWVRAQCRIVPSSMLVQETGRKKEGQVRSGFEHKQRLARRVTEVWCFASVHASSCPHTYQATVGLLANLSEAKPQSCGYFDVLLTLTTTDTTLGQSQVGRLGHSEVRSGQVYYSAEV